MDPQDMQPPQKPKKLVLPKCYIRNPRTHNFDELCDVLDLDMPLINATLEASTHASRTVEEATSIQVEENAVIVAVESTETKKKSKVKTSSKEGDKPTKDRRPSAYNVFVKETLANLVHSHAQLTSRERFSLAIKMWNDRKTAAAQ